MVATTQRRKTPGDLLRQAADRAMNMVMQIGALWQMRGAPVETSDRFEQRYAEAMGQVVLPGFGSAIQ